MSWKILIEQLDSVLATGIWVFRIVAPLDMDLCNRQQMVFYYSSLFLMVVVYDDLFMNYYGVHCVFLYLCNIVVYC